MILDLTQQVVQAQIAFGLAVVALLLAYIAFGRKADSKRKKN
jgi:hypothetical protein